MSAVIAKVGPGFEVRNGSKVYMVASLLEAKAIFMKIQYGPTKLAAKAKAPCADCGGSGYAVSPCPDGCCYVGCDTCSPHIGAC